MNFVEQAVFTSAETNRTAGYQLVAKSAGISEEDGRVLSTWGPSHGSLLESGRQALSVNFHSLPSGNYCLSRTSASGNEYSGRGVRIYTQCLVVSPQTLRHFANNPFAVIRAASGSGLLKQHEKVPRTLDSVPLVGRVPAVDPALVARSRREFGPKRIARLVQASLGCASMAIAGTSRGELAIGVLFNCLPPQIRPEFSFSTGLRTSARRPFRLVALGTDAEEQRRARQIEDLTLMDIADEPVLQFAAMDGLAQVIYQIVETGRTSLLNRWFENHSSEVTIDQLNAMGLEWLEELTRNGASENGVTLGSVDVEPPRSEDAILDDEGAKASGETAPNPQVSRQQAHAAHPRFQGTSAAEERASSPSATLAFDDPQIVARLERLDDLVYDAIKGDHSSLAQLQAAWPRLKTELGEELLGHSREQYLRYALQIWEQCVETTGVRATDRAVSALDVLCLLFDEV